MGSRVTHPYDSITLAQLRRRKSWKWQKYADDVLPLWVAEMDFPLAQPIRDTLITMVECSDTGYPWSPGLPEAYAEFSSRRYGFTPDAGTCYVLQDIMRGIEVTLEVLSEPGSSVAFFTPAYPPFFHCVEYVHRAVAPVPFARDSETGRYDIDFERLDAVLARPDVSTFLLCNPHNPTGRVFGVDELSRIAELAARHGVLVLSDEVHAPLVYSGARHVPFASLDHDVAARSVTFVSASKAWNIPGLKCAMAIAGGPQPWKALRDLPVEISIGTSLLGIAANIAAYRDGEPWLADTLEYLDGNRRLLAERLRERLPEVTYAMPDATYLAWLDCTALSLEDDPAAVFLEHGRVALNSGTHYGEPEGAGFVRLNFGTTRRFVGRAVDAMARAVSGGPERVRVGHDY